METFRPIYTPDVVQSQPGNNQTSGEYNGVDKVLGLYGGLFELSGGTISADLRRVDTEGEKVVTVHHMKAEREGKTLNADETIEFTFAGDKISRLDLRYADQAAEDAFWADRLVRSVGPLLGAHDDRPARVANLATDNRFGGVRQ
jgi:ketosteroid isomerase-like protein